eukprot:TRINITY_DN4311_c0_g1_i1.p1 TRINITY_DN4311_c0_g1~~TRINITY_DN4311_c0_g1_i1.p1  ORF type:complete len:299 (-),score=82.20 TRINITY_DN4311_c0_g1_i1:204-1100(-)
MTIKSHDLLYKSFDIIHNTHNYDHWFCSLDINKQTNCLYSGDNLGFIVSGDLRTKSILFNHRLHKNKISHLEFHPQQSNLFLTASNDKRICFWDIRKISQNIQPLQTIVQESCTNSAYFSPESGKSLLVTSQNSTINIYRIASRPLSFESNQNQNQSLLEKSYNHPHKFYQHMTAIKAIWHPHYKNTFLCGRYDEKIRGIDVFNLSDDQPISHIGCKMITGVLPVLAFDITGRILVSATGQSAFAWTNSSIIRKKVVKNLKINLNSNSKLNVNTSRNNLNDNKDSNHTSSESDESNQF